ncbi:hypothetical protein ACFLRF_00065 [Candidatus Altiarchaeota archaeon]
MIDTKKGKLIVLTLQILILGGLVLTSIGIIPIFYSYLWGEELVQKYLKEEIGDYENSRDAALKILKFTDQKNGRITWFYDKKPTLPWIGWIIYNVNGSYMLFIRGGEESWILKTGMGNCGEVAWFFSSMMNRSGFSANPIRLHDRNGPGHMIAEFRDEDNNRIFVDPFAGAFIQNITEYTKYWVYAETVDFQDKFGETTSSMIDNTSKISLVVDNTSHLNSFSSIRISQVGADIVNKHITEMDDYDIFLRNGNYTVMVEVDLHIVKFQKEIILELSDDVSIKIDYSELVSIDNLLKMQLIAGLGIGIIFAYLINTKLTGRLHYYFNKKGNK